MLASYFLKTVASIVAVSLSFTGVALIFCYINLHQKEQQMGMTIVAYANTICGLMGHSVFHESDTLTRYIDKLSSYLDKRTN